MKDPGYFVVKEILNMHSFNSNVEMDHHLIHFIIELFLENDNMSDCDFLRMFSMCR